MTNEAKHYTCVALFEVTEKGRTVNRELLSTLTWRKLSIPNDLQMPVADWPLHTVPFSLIVHLNVVEGGELYPSFKNRVLLCFDICLIAARKTLFVGQFFKSVSQQTNNFSYWLKSNDRVPVVHRLSNWSCRTHRNDNKMFLFNRYRVLVHFVLVKDNL